MTHVKPPVVAGLFYPDQRTALRHEVEGFLGAAHPPAGQRPHALVAPHAGYRYSGSIAASAYATLIPWVDSIRRVVVLAPSHRVAFRGIALSSDDAFATPLGDIPVDTAARDRLLDLPGVGIYDAAFAQEHALEVQLPFLQSVLDEFTLVPVVVGDADADDVARVIEALRDDDTLIVVSSDLSHYHAYADCQTRDRATSAKIEALRGDQIGPYDACGAFPLRGLLKTAQDHDWRVATLDLRNSGDTAGDRTRVVGYGAYAFY
ncbi:MAG: AmmeMemoRadiSam system protein B [Chromatiaceae bacterium]|nr:AmmeMemoRadiSam system protein B [Chromatiaceae bacterium]MCP5422737.1 AmmeMemoRadiSam system protein B [Chromatiaceae bacterium]